jgi:Tol biopolymer transport system component
VADEGGIRIVDMRSRRSTDIALPEGSFGFSFSPDGSQLAFARATSKGQNVYSVSTDGGPVRPLTDDDRSSSPLWGPRGIAFERYGVDGKGDRCGNCHGDVWMMDGDGGDVRQLTHTHAGIYPAAWSGDGSRMLAAYPATHNGKLYAVDVSDGNARALTGFVGDLFAQGLSRDGRTVLAAIGCGGMIGLQGVIETIPFSGGPPAVIIHGPCRASWNA